MALLTRKPDYVKILLCLEVPKMVAEVTSYAIVGGVEASPSTAQDGVHLCHKFCDV